MRSQDTNNGAGSKVMRKLLRARAEIIDKLKIRNSAYQTKRENQ